MEVLLKNTRKTYFLFLILSFLFYGNSITNSFCFDDAYVTPTNFPEPGKKYVPNKETVAKGFKGIPELWRSRYGHGKGTAYDYRPVVTTLFAIEYAVFGQSPHINHTINIILYSLIILLLFLILKKCLIQYPFREMFAFVCCLLFLAHPIHTEVTDSIKSCDELLGLLLALLSTYLCVTYFEEKKIIYLLCAPLFLFLSIYAKLTSSVFVLIIPLVLVFFTKAGKKQILLFLLAGFVVLLIQSELKKILVTEKEIRILYHFENPLATENVTFFARLLFAVKTTGIYIKLLIFPYPLRFYYGPSMITSSVAMLDPDVILAVVFFGSAIYFCYKTKNKPAFFGLSFFLICIVPVTNLLKPVAGIVGERLAFNPSVGFIIFITSVIFHFCKNPPVKPSWNFFIKKPFVYVSVLLFIYLFYTWSRNSNWHDELTLFEHDAPFVEKSAGANNLIGNKFFENIENPKSKYPTQILVQKCWKHYNLAVEADSSVFSAYNNAGVIAYRFMNNPELAKTYFIRAIRGNYDFPQAHENLADCYGKTGNYKEAVKEYELSLLQNPKGYKAYISLTSLYFTLKNYGMGLNCLTRAVKEFPKSAELMIGQSTCYKLMGQPKPALKKLEEVYRMYPVKIIADSILAVSKILNDTQTYNRYHKLFY